MTLNLSLVTNDHAICVTDRRLSALSGGIVSERGNKLTIFQCANAHGFVTYNGIGRDLGGLSPNDWLADRPGLALLPFEAFVEAVRNIMAERLMHLAAKGYDTRHSFVVAGFAETVPVLVLISNYESLREDGWKAEADPELSVEVMGPSPGTVGGKLLLATGAFPDGLKRRFRQLARQPATSAKPEALRARMTKLLRDVAYHGDRRASVGSSVLTAIVPRFGAIDVSMDVVGGSSVQELPNMIAPGFSMRDVYVDTSGDPQFRYSRVQRKAVIREHRCSVCRSPVPEGYAKCGICDARTSGADDSGPR